MCDDGVGLVAPRTTRPVLHGDDGLIGHGGSVRPDGPPAGLPVTTETSLCGAAHFLLLAVPNAFHVAGH